MKLVLLKLQRDCAVKFDAKLKVTSLKVRNSHVHHENSIKKINWSVPSWDLIVAASKICSPLHFLIEFYDWSFVIHYNIYDTFSLDGVQCVATNQSFIGKLKHNIEQKRPPCRHTHKKYI